MYSFHKVESGRLRTGSRCRPDSSCTGRDSSGCGALQKVCLIGPEPPFGLRGGGSCSNPCRCMRSMATRQLISLRPPSGLNQPKSWQAKRESWARERVGSSPISSHSRRISRPLKSRPQKRFIQPPLPASWPRSMRGHDGGQGRKGSRSGGGCPPCLAQACR